MAIDQLRARRVDVVVTGGVDADLSPETHVAFSLTGAMSAGASRPFNADADGFVMGEGAAMFVLRRLDDALADGDPIWAIVRGVGQSSDGRGPGITAPSEHGQALAIRRAWEEAGAPTRRASMIEAHGTGTQVGDRAEGAVLNTLFGGGDHPVWVGSIKSNIGHLKGAAGAVGLFKAVLALATGVIPPTLHAGPIRADVPAGALRFPRRPTSLAGSPRVAGVSAFGFGGTNYHLVVEQAPPDARRPGWLDEATRLAEAAAAPADDAAWRHDAGEDPPADTKDAAPRVTAWSSTTADDDARTLRGPSASIGSAAAAPRRLVLCAWPSVFAQRRDAWVEAASTGAPLPPGAIVGVGSPARLVWAFPGQGSVRPGAVRVARGYEAAARVLEAIEQHLPDAFAAAGVTGLAPRLGALEGRDPASPPGPLRQHVVLYALGAAWARQLSEDGVPMAAAVGHSVGEIAALHAAGALDLIDGLRLVVARGAALEACPEGAMLAVSGPPEVVAAVLPLGVSLAAVNGPRAVVLSGPPEAIEAAQQALTAAGSRCVPLAVTRAYHGPLVDAAKQRLIDALDSCSFHEPGVPVLSGYHAAPFSADPRAPLADGLVSTVRFHDALTAALATASPTGAAVVLEVGPGRALSHHATAALAAIPLDPEGTVEGPARAAATLLAHGHPGLALRCAATLAPPLADRAAPTPAAAVAERADTSAPNDPLRSTIIAVITEVTGYEAHHLTPGVSLDADLGVDSVRKMEILGALQDRLGLVVPERALASATSGDLDALVAFVRAHLPAAGAAAPVADAAFVPTDAPALFAWSFVVAPQAGATRVSAVPLPRRSGPTEAAVADALAAWFASPPPSDTPLVLVAPAPGGQLSPDQAAVCAAARCWGRERDQSVRVITYDLDAPHDVVAAERVAARTGDSHVFGDGAVVVRARAPLIPLPPPRLRRVLATGGPGGVVGACLAALAPCDVVVLARTDPSSDSPAAARVREALEALHGVGAACTVIPTDVGDYAAVHAGVAVARTLLGGFDLVLHGAGVLDDRRSEHVDAPSTTRVLAPKVRGATHLIEATRDDAPALWMTLSSLAAETGNVGQSVYAAANAAMEALAHPSATRSCALRTTVWEGVGMGDPAVARALRLVGRAPLTRAQGQAAFLQACAREGVVTCDGTAAVGASALRWSTPGVARSVSLTLQPSADALRDHRVGSNTVVPAALWYELLVELVAATRGAPGPWLTPPPRGAEPIAPVRGFAADRAPLPSSALPRVASDLPTSSEDPTSPLVGAGPVALSEVVVPRATVVRAPQDAVITVNHGEAWVEVDGAPRARAQIGGTPGDAPPIDPAGTGEDASRFYRPDVLFHGATWRVLDRVGARGDAAWATLRATGASPSAAAVDAIHQVAALLLGPSSGHLGLPTGAAAAWFARTRPATRVQVVRTGPWTCDAAAYADDGAAVVVMRGVTLSPAAPWPAAVAAIGEEP
jgi:malonyl CoA-acyl carrier protein transacylase/NADP-dependent 3-hydroxy acid dehydrogenase YdfG/acyl carrier protein